MKDTTISQGAIADDRLATVSATPDEVMTSQPPDPMLADVKCRVLVIEDEPLVSMEIETSLSTAGHRVIGPAQNFETGAELAANEEIDVALLDVNLSGAAVDDIAAVLARRNIPFGFVTGYGRAALPPRFKDCPCLGKPFSPVQLLELVMSLRRMQGAAARDGAAEKRRKMH